MVTTRSRRRTRDRCEQRSSSLQALKRARKGEAVRKEKEINDVINGRGAHTNKQPCTRLKSHPVYRLIVTQISKMVPNPRKYEKYAEPDTSIMEKPILEEVYSGERGETIKHWLARAKCNGEQDKFEVDYIVATEHRAMGEMQFIEEEDCKVLIKWTGYPIPTWERSDNLESLTQRLPMLTRTLQLDLIELNIRDTMGNDYFEQKLPNRYFKCGNSVGAYILLPRASYENRLRAIEYHFNVINERWGQPPVYVIDWTGMKRADQTLKDLEYIQMCLLSKGVRDLMVRRPQAKLHHLKCSSNCKTCTLEKRTDTVRFCCRLSESLELDKTGVPRFIMEGTPSCVVPFRTECTEECSCPESKCKNRVVQRGRQKPLAIFRDPMKQWTIRAVTEFAEHELITEYCGKVQLEKTTGRSQQFDFSLGYDAVRDDGKKRPLVISAFKMGNEARFISHSCEPNAYFQTTVIERDALCTNRGAVHALRPIAGGEEITLDYFDGKGLNDFTIDFSAMFPESGCACNSPRCRFTPEAFKFYKRGLK